MEVFSARLEKFGKNGEKTGWTYISIPAEVSERIMPGIRKSFRVKGFIDAFPIHSVAMLPMGDGSFIIACNAQMRKGIGKREGAEVRMSLEADHTVFEFDQDFMTCLEEDKEAHKYFQEIPPSHQKYYSKWISEAKSESTKANRIAKALRALSRRMSYGEMIRESKGN